MSTATTRLRRAGAGGLAAAVIAGTLVASAGIASAAATPVSGTYQLTSTATKTTIFPGTASQAAGDVEYWFASSWTTGATITFTLPGNVCTTAAGLANAVSFSAAPTAAVTGPFVQASGAAGTAAKPTFSTALSSSGGAGGACDLAGIKDIFTVTLNQPSNPIDTNQVFALTLTGIKYTTGSARLPGDINLGLANGGGLPAPTPAASVANATVVNSKLAAASVAPTVPGAKAVALGNITLSDIGGSQVTSPITFTLSAPTGSGFTTTSTPKLTGPAGTTWDVTVAAATVTATLATGSGAIPTTSANTFVLSGVQIDAGTAGAVGVVASYKDRVSALTVNVGPAVAASVVTQARNGGADRYATAASVFATSTHTAVLASGANFPDALSANYLAGIKGAGILLTTPTALPSVTFNTMISKLVTTVYIVGGTGAVSQAVENQIASTHIGNIPSNALISVIRLGGADRYATNLAVNEYTFSTHGTAVVATGENFADALAVGPAVSMGGVPTTPAELSAHMPLILTATASLSSAAKQQLVDMGVTNVVIAGGTGAVSSAVETAIKGLGITTTRLAGTDRTQTAAAVAVWETTSVANGGLGFIGTNNVYVTNGATYPDALAAGPVAGAAESVILLTLSPTDLGAGAPTFLNGSNLPKASGTSVDTLTALGLTGAVSPAVMNSAAVALVG